jgi:asparagine synthase (glutamine-hydrolysing)
MGRLNSFGSDRSARPGLSAGLKFLGRRGPDSHREWMSSDGQVELLHARLAIVDTDSRAHQPFTDERNEMTVALNGEIYNYRELRAQLSSYEFRTQSDTEVIIALYVTHGLSGLKQLRGMFALCLIDEKARRVYLVRDPIGKKPLFLARWSGGAYFGSSVLALLAASGHEARLVSEAVADFWEDGHVSPDQSLVEGCTPVLPGHVVELDWDGAVENIGSCVPNGPELPPKGDLAAAQQQISELISQSVQRRLLNNPNPVSLLSGGIDSTVVTSHMKSVAGGSAITLGSFVPGMHDEKHARYAAQRIQVPLQTVRARSPKLAEDAAWALDLQDEPLGMISFFPLALMIRAAKDYGRILLTGDGGDEVFLGYGNAEDWMADDLGELPAGSAGNSLSGSVAAPEWMSDWGRNMVTNSLVGHMFSKLDRASAEQGVEARCPLLDWDLVAFVRTLGPDLLFFDGRTKALLKAELQDWPSRFTDRRKIGFAYNLRWAWAVSRFEGLRALVSSDAVEEFGEKLPTELQRDPSSWSSLAIFNNFPVVWKLLAWTSFKERLRLAAVTAREQQTPVALEAAVV